MTDIGATIAPKSDQLNADDLITGPRTITITRVSASPSSPEQPVSVFFEGDNGKPYKPCKSMRRVMVAAWGANGNEYAGRSMTLYRDESVRFGGIEVGGIRISHMSHIDREMVMALTASKTKRTPYTVKPLKIDAPKVTPPAGKYVLRGRGTDDLGKWSAAFLDLIGKATPEQAKALHDAHKDQLQKLAQTGSQEEHDAAWAIIDALGKKAPQSAGQTGEPE